MQSKQLMDKLVFFLNKIVIDVLIGAAPPVQVDVDIH